MSFKRVPKSAVRVEGTRETSENRPRDFPSDRAPCFDNIDGKRRSKDEEGNDSSYA